jgi:lysophospholipase L1-like esterase
VNPKVRTRRSRLILSLVLLLGVMSALEGFVRMRQWLKYGTIGSFYAFELHEASGLRVPAPGITEGREHVISVNSLGFRGPELELPKPGGRTRIAFLGGSTTFCAEASGDETTWPALVQGGLAARYAGASIDMVNAGAAAYSSKHSLANLTHRVAPTSPDILVIYHGTNDISQDARAQAKAAGLLTEEDDEPSWLAKVSVAWQLAEKNFSLTRAAEDSGGRTLDLDLAAGTAAFRARLTALVEAARLEARTVVLVTFAHKVRHEQDDATRRASSNTSLYWLPFMTVDGVLQAFDAYNVVVAEVAAATGVVLVEGENRIPGDDAHFADSVHLTDAGCEIQAARVLDALCSSPALDWLAD